MRYQINCILKNVLNIWNIMRKIYIFSRISQNEMELWEKYVEDKFMPTPTWPKLLEPIARNHQHLFDSILGSPEFQLCTSRAISESSDGCQDESYLPPT